MTLADYDDNIAGATPMTEENIPAEDLIAEFGLELQSDWFSIKRQLWLLALILFDDI